MHFQPAFDSCQRVLLILLLLSWYLQELCKADQFRGEHLLGVGFCPEDDLVFLPIAVGILKGNLCLAHSSKAAQSQWLFEGTDSIPCERLMELLKDLFATSKTHISRI